MTLSPGTLPAQGRQTAVAALRHGGKSMVGNWSSFYQVFNRTRWPRLSMSRHLLLLIIGTLVPAGACVDLVIDETLERL